MEMFNKISTNICKYCFIIMAILFSVANVVFTTRVYNDGKVLSNYNFGITPLHILIVVIILGLIWILNKKDYFGLKEKNYLIILLIIVTCIGLYWIMSNPRQLVDYDDSYNCFNAATKILNKDYGPLGFRSYINMYPHNLPLVTYFMVIIKIFGDNAITAICLINLLFVVIGYLYLYKITNIIFNNRRTNMNMITLMLLSLQFVFFSNYVYGNVLSISLSLVSIYYLIKYIKDNKKRYFVISLITISIGAGVKNNVLIVLVAEVIYLVIETINKEKIINLLLILSLILGSTICTKGVIKFWEHKANYSYDNSLPKICWIAYGLNYDERHPGSYINDFEQYHHENGFIVEYTSKKAKEFINMTLDAFKRNPMLIPKFLGEKLLIAWANPEYGVFSYGHLLRNNDNEFNLDVINGTKNNILNNIWDGALTIVSIGLLVFIFKRRKNMELLELILGVVFIGGVLVSFVLGT